MINLNIENLKEKALNEDLCWMNGVSVRKIDEILIDGVAKTNVFYCDMINNFALLYLQDEKNNPVIVDGAISLVVAFGKISFVRKFS